MISRCLLWLGRATLMLVGVAMIVFLRGMSVQPEATIATVSAWIRDLGLPHFSQWFAANALTRFLPADFPCNPAPGHEIVCDVTELLGAPAAMSAGIIALFAAFWLLLASFWWSEWLAQAREERLRDNQRRACRRLPAKVSRGDSRGAPLVAKSLLFMGGRTGEGG